MEVAVAVVPASQLVLAVYRGAETVTISGRQHHLPNLSRLLRSLKHLLWSTVNPTSLDLIGELYVTTNLQPANNFDLSVKISSCF